MSISCVITWFAFLKVAFFFVCIFNGKWKLILTKIYIPSIPNRHFLLLQMKDDNEDPISTTVSQGAAWGISGELFSF